MTLTRPRLSPSLDQPNKKLSRSKLNLWLLPLTMRNLHQHNQPLDQASRKRKRRRLHSQQPRRTTMAPQLQKTLNKNKLNKIIKHRIEVKFERERLSVSV